MKRLLPFPGLILLDNIEQFGCIFAVHFQKKTIR